MTTFFKRVWKIVQPRPFDIHRVLDAFGNTVVHSVYFSVLSVLMISLGASTALSLTADNVQGVANFFTAFFVGSLLIFFISQSVVSGILDADADPRIEEIAERIADLDDDDATRVNAYIDYLLEERSHG